MITVTPEISIAPQELRFDFIRASGPGGQNVNKVSSAVQLRFDVGRTTALPGEVKSRLRKIAGKKLTADGILVIQASRFKSQEQNRQDAVQRLANLIRQAAIRPKKRVKTKPSKRAKQRRLETKRRRSRLKQNRRSIRDNGDGA